MGNLNGFVKLHRKMIEWGWYSDCVVKDVFIHILMVATFKPTKYLGYDLKPGQAVIGRKKLAEELGFTEQQVRTALKKLESTGEISLFSTNRFTIATVENWEFYQGDCDTEQPTDNQQITNKQPHLKNVKNVKNVKEIIYSDVPELNEAIIAFIDYRKTIKKPMSDRAITLLLGKLNKMSNSVQEQIEILNQSILNGWQGIFPLKSDSGTGKKASFQGRNYDFDELEKQIVNK